MKKNKEKEQSFLRMFYAPSWPDLQKILDEWRKWLKEPNSISPFMEWDNLEFVFDGKVTKQDVEIAKNYLQEPEMKELRYIVNLFLDYAEHKAESEEKIFMREWEILLDDFLAFNKKEILPHAGSISLEKALEKAHNEYFKYRENLKISEKKESEIEHKEDIKELEKLLKKTEE